jgi:hypothetical protein
LVERERWPDRARATEALAVAALIALAYLLLRTAPALAAGAFMDDGVYLSLGKALADGEGYRSVYAAGAPVHLKYPPALPFLHSILWRVRGDLAFVHSAALLLSVVATACTAGILWWIARARLELPALLVAVLVVGPFLLEGSVQYFNLAISEPWFMLGWASCLLLAPLTSTRLGWAVGVGALAGVTALFRAQAVVLLPALAAAVWLQGRDPRRAGALVGGGVVPIAAWTLWHRSLVATGPVSTQPDEGAYTTWAPDSALEAVVDGGRVLWSHATGYWDVLPVNLAPWAWLGAVVWVVMLATFLLGVVRHGREHPAIVLTIAAAGAAVLVWPFTQDRFVLAILPFAGLMTALECRSLALLRRPALATALAVIVGVVGIRQVQIRGLAESAEPTDTAVRFHPAQLLPANTEFVIAASRWIGASARPDDRLLTPLPSALWLYTRRQGVNSVPALPSVGSSVFDEPGRFLASRVVEDDVTLLLLWNPSFLITRDAATVQQACPEALEFLTLTEEPARVAIFRIRRDDPCLVDRFLAPARTPS